MISWLKNSTRFILVTVGIVALTSFTIDATDTLSGSQTALSILTNKAMQDSCPDDMVLIINGSERFCLDLYEASPSTNCLYQKPGNVTETTVNISKVDCVALSVEKATPWTFVAWPQAEQLCAKSQKRLPTASEWYQGSLGTPDSVSNCNLSGEMTLTGNFSSCRSGSGAHDLIGNVWELISAKTTDGIYNGRAVPSEGYVDLVDESGIAVETSEKPNDIYNQDYFWSSNGGQYVLMRGGFYGSRSDGGIYSTYAQGNQNFAGVAVGFRCAKSL